MNHFLKFLALALVTFSLGCTGKKTSTNEVNLAIWGNYISDHTAQRFTQESGIKLNISYYSSNEELLAKVQSGASGIDVAVPSEYMVEIMSQNGLLEPLNAQELGIASELNPQIQLSALAAPYALPYAWTTTGIAYHKDLFPEGIKDWANLFSNKALSGKISLMDDAREVIGAALKMHGHSINSVNPEELKKAEKTLAEVKPRVKMFTSDPIDSLLNKEVAVAQIYSSDALQAQRKSNGSVVFVLPSEGGARAVDTLVIFKSAKNKENGLKLLKFLLNRKTNIEFVSHVLAGSVLKDVKKDLPAEIQSLAPLFPEAAAFAKFEDLKDVGENTKLFDQIWTRIKTD
ncbi:MAG: spermidine/putrescine ABC transporter substrate-binding protein [Proteobacteria bacterium]|jgi:spermidine/putrescine transport system substrate-binding protein|nr:spermidine/putrescine ABC transporter substrate-binding protein [Pseudomonadota bacterium]